MSELLQSGNIVRTAHHPEKTKVSLVNRLRRIEGQIRGTGQPGAQPQTQRRSERSEGRPRDGPSVGSLVRHSRSIG